MPNLPDLVPARMLNEHAYCPRLAYLEWVQGDFADNPDTVDGRFVHRIVNAESGAMPDPDEPQPETLHARSVMLSAPALGLIARMDLIEADGTAVTPIDYKRGRAPDLPEGAWEPERVQLCAQAFVLEENGYRVARGELYFATSKQRVTIEIDEALRQRTRELLAEMRASAERPVPPPPLRDSPKCPRCSLVGICLPDEINLLRGEAPGEEADPDPDPEVGAEVGPDAHGEGLPSTAAAAPRAEAPPARDFVPASRVRRLVPARDDALPLYVHTGGTRVGRSGAELIVEPREGE